MVSIKLEKDFIRQNVTLLREHLRVPLFANAYMLVANQAATAVLGLLYWAVAARLYPVEVVGENAAIISSIIFLAMLSELSLKSAATRFVPRAGKNTVGLIVTTLGINMGVAFLVSSFLLTLGRHFKLTADLLTDIKFAPIWIILAAMVWTVFYVLDGILTGMRQAKSVLVKNAIQSIAKIVLLIVFFRSFAQFGLVISWFLPAPIIVLAFSGLIFWRFLPEHLKLDLTQTKAITQRELFTSISGDYIGGILAETSTRLLPLLVLFFLGKESTAYFNQAWVVATPFYLVATNMSSSFVVEASANMRQIGLHSRRILRQMLIFLVPAVGLMWLTAPILLSAFGKNYAQGGFQLLRWLILTTLPFMFNAWFLSYARVLGKAKTIILVQATQLVITLGICYVALPRYGINSVGIAWLSSQCVIFIVALFKSIPVLWSNIAQDVKNTTVTRNQLFRRVDWRFLLGKSQVERSICFTNGLLAQSVAAISKQSLDSTSNVTGECDLAVAINPDSATLYAAREALHTEGSLYVEWSPLLAGGMRSIRRRLQNAGFSHIRWYVPLPNPVRPLFWIPLDSSKAASQYIARRLFPGDRLVQRFMRSIVINTLGALMRAGLVPYLSAIANKGTEPFTDIFDEIRFAWQRIHPETQAEQLSFLIKTGGLQLYSKIIWLVFAKSDSEGPDWIVKVPRFHEDAGSLQHEKLILSDLGSALQEKNSVLRIPVTLFNLKRNEVELYVQTGLRGEPLTQIISEDRFQEIALRLTKTQIALAESTKSWTGTVTSQELVDQMLNKLVLFVGSLPAFQHLLQSQQILKNFDAVPLVCTHNDFTPWNIIQESDSLGIFDWSDAEQRGLPMLDLIYGLSTLAFTMDRTHNGEDMRVSYQRLLDSKKRRGAIFGECLSFYAASLGIPSQQIGYLRLLTWMRHSFNELDNHKVEMADSTRPFHSICASIWNLELEYQQFAQIERSARGKQDQNG